MQRRFSRRWSRRALPAISAIVVVLTAMALSACQKKPPEEDLLKKVEPVAKAHLEVRAPLGQLVSEARAASAGLRRGIEAGDRGAVAREVGRLADLHRRFEAVGKTSGGGGS
jgi:hypothetical protein